MSEEPFTQLPSQLFNAAASSSTSYSFVNSEVLGQRAIVIHNFCSPEECDAVVDYMQSIDRPPAEEGEVVMTSAGSKVEYRNHKRALAQSEEVAEILLKRVHPILASIDQAVVHCREDNCKGFIQDGIGMRGAWAVHSINPMFRLAKYDPLGHLGPHCDGDRIVDPIDHRSLKTFMVYLNDDYEGGATSFSHDHDLYIDPVRGIWCSPPEAIHSRLKAQKGDCLIFDHKILHEGQQVLSGHKYIIRSEIMYKKKAQRCQSDDDLKMEQAVRLFNEGISLEEQHRVDDAIKLYRRAYKLCPALEGVM